MSYTPGPKSNSEKLLGIASDMWRFGLDDAEDVKDLHQLH
jgi:hypothetical protein